MPPAVAMVLAVVVVAEIAWAAFVLAGSDDLRPHAVPAVVESHDGAAGALERRQRVPIQRPVGVGAVLFAGHHAGHGVDDDQGGVVMLCDGHQVDAAGRALADLLQEIDRLPADTLRGR